MVAPIACTEYGPNGWMDDSETQEFEWLNFLKRIVKKVDRKLFHASWSHPERRERERV